MCNKYTTIVSLASGNADRKIFSKNSSRILVRPHWNSGKLYLMEDIKIYGISYGRSVQCKDSGSGAWK